MKIQYKSLILGLGAVLALSSCGRRDVLEPILEDGQAVPTAYWEVGSSSCKAGESFTFQGKYYVEPGKQVDRSEVWYRVKRDETGTATVKLAGSSLSYTKTYTSADTMRELQPVVVLPHSQAEWDGYEYIVKGEVPVSRTLSPQSWKAPSEWDADRFNGFYPQGFDQEFCNEVIEYLTKDSTYYNALRQVYINYPFENADFTALNTKHNLHFPDNIDMSGDDKGSSDKSDLWFSTTEAKEADITGYYYSDLTADGEKVYHEIAKDAPTVGEDGKVTYNGFSCYPVYKSSDWVFCRYDDDLGAIISTVRHAYIPAFKELLAKISFEEWIFDSTTKEYGIEFQRTYKLDSQFRVYDTEGEEGIAYDVREITIN